MFDRFSFCWSRLEFEFFDGLGCIGLCFFKGVNRVGFFNFVFICVYSFLFSVILYFLFLGVFIL